MPIDRRRGSRPSQPDRPRRLLLVGGGHAHLEVLRRYGLERPPAFSVALVSPDPVHLYSGMLTGYLAGEYELRELTFPLEALAAWAGATFVQGRVEQVHTDDRTVALADGRRLEYDAVSFDVGSGVGGLELPGVARHALPVKPLTGIPAIAEALDRAPAGNARVLVVGGGSAGVELALCALARLDRREAGARMAIAEQGDRLLAEQGLRAGAAAHRALSRRGVSVLLRTRIARAETGAVWTASGEAHPFDALIWAAGPAAPSLFARSALPKDAAGYLSVDASLQAVGQEGVFGAGDCVSLAGAPGLAKTGVYAVREAPVLWHALRAYLTGGRLGAYRPQRHYLYALNTGDGRAMLGRRRFWSHSRWARWLKERIDRRFMRRYLRLLHGAR